MSMKDISAIILTFNEEIHIEQCYLGKWIRFEGRYPLKLLRIWRAGKGEMEHRWMDKHIKIIVRKWTD